MIGIEDLSYKAGKKYLLQNVSVRFMPGRLNLIIGPNGAGKSTLIRIISGQLSSFEGTVQIAGRDIHHFPVRELARFRAVLSQHTELAFPLTAREVVMMGRYPHFAGSPSSVDKDICAAAMQFFNVTELADRNYLTLSGGEQQRVQFARVLAQIWDRGSTDHRYLILDEPLTFLDVHYQHDFMNKLKELLQQKDLCVVGVVHDLNLAARFADHLVLLYSGKVLASGTPREVLTPQLVKAAYQLEPVLHQEGDTMFLYF